jgi:hypothetical protein
MTKGERARRSRSPRASCYGSCRRATAGRTASAILPRPRNHEPSRTLFALVRTMETSPQPRTSRALTPRHAFALATSSRPRPLLPGPFLTHAHSNAGLLARAIGPVMYLAPVSDLTAALALVDNADDVRSRPCSDDLGRTEPPRPGRARPTPKAGFVVSWRRQSMIHQQDQTPECVFGLLPPSADPRRSPALRGPLGVHTPEASRLGELASPWRARSAFVRRSEWRARAVAAQPLESLAITRAHQDARVHIEPRHFRHPRALAGRESEAQWPRAARPRRLSRGANRCFRRGTVACTPRAARAPALRSSGFLPAARREGHGGVASDGCAFRPARQRPRCRLAWVRGLRETRAAPSSSAQKSPSGTRT